MSVDVDFAFASWDEPTRAHVHVALDDVALARAAELVRAATSTDEDGAQGASPAVRGALPRNAASNKKKGGAALPVDPDAPPRLWLRASPSVIKYRGLNGLGPASATWALLVLDADFDAARAAFAPLLEHRRALGVAFAHPKLAGEPGLLRVTPPLSNTPQRWEAQILAASGGRRLPSHLLFVGGPDRFPWNAQLWMDTQPDASTGRIDLGASPTGPLDWGACRVYAEKVVRYEKGAIPVARRALFYSFSADDPTKRANDALVAPLREHVAGPDLATAHLQESLALLGKAATTEALCKTLGEERPALVMTASHGVERAKDPAVLFARMGALTDVNCLGDTGAVLSADRIPTSPFAPGAVFFAFACFSAGTPQMSTHQFLLSNTRADIAPRPFVSALPRAMLAHPEGPIAFIGHVDRATSESFADEARLDAFRDLFTIALAGGGTLGAALRPLRAQLGRSSHLLVQSLNPARNKPEDQASLLRSWMRYHDQAGYVLLGDPLLRIGAALPSP